MAFSHEIRTFKIVLSYFQRHLVVRLLKTVLPCASGISDFLVLFCFVVFVLCLFFAGSHIEEYFLGSGHILGIDPQYIRRRKATLGKYWSHIMACLIVCMLVSLKHTFPSPFMQQGGEIASEFILSINCEPSSLLTVLRDGQCGPRSHQRLRWTRGHQGGLHQHQCVYQWLTFCLHSRLCIRVNEQAHFRDVLEEAETLGCLPNAFKFSPLQKFLLKVSRTQRPHLHLNKGLSWKG